MDFESESEEEEEEQEGTTYVPKNTGQQKKQTGIFSLFKYKQISLFNQARTLFIILTFVIGTWWDQRPSLKK